MVQLWRGCWLLYAAGTAVSSYGAYGLLGHAAETQPRRAALWLGGGVLLHDAVLAPLVLLVAAVVVRLVPQVARPVLQGALFVSGALALVALPVLSGRGGSPDPTSNPLPYGRNLLLALAVVWTAAVLVGLVRRLRRRQREPAAGRA